MLLDQLKTRKSIIMLFIYLILFFNTAIDSNGQSFWAIQLGGTGDDYGHSIVSDSAGNIFVTGFFSGIADFDPSTNTNQLNSSGGRDIFIAKFDENRNYVWAKRIGGSGDDESNQIVIDELGNIYIVGYFQGSADFDPSNGSLLISSNGLKDAFLMKMDSAGSLLWAHGFGGIGNDESEGLCLDPNGNVSVTGTFSQSVDFDYGPGISNATSNGGLDNFILKSDDAGTFVWAMKFGGVLDDYSKSLKTDTLGNIIVTGYFQDNLDFDPSPGTLILTSSGVFDCFIAKFSQSGNLIWAKKIGSGSSDGGNSLDIDRQGNIYTTGFFSGPTDFDPGPGVNVLTPPSGTTGYSDVFICKYDSSGNLLWAGRVGGNFLDVGHYISLGLNDELFITGRFHATADFDPGPGIVNLTSPALTTGAYSDVFIVKLDTNGSYKFAKRLGGKSNDTGFSINQDIVGNVYTIGNFSGLAGFDPSSLTFPSGFTMTSSGPYDAFISKLIFKLIKKQPIDKSATVNTSQSFEIKGIQGSVYQWQIKSGGVFQNILNGGQYLGADTDSLIVNNINLTNNGSMFRCVLSNGTCYDTSNVALLTVINNTSTPETASTAFQISPNPFQSFVEIKSPIKMNGVTFYIVNSMNQVVYDGVLNSNSTFVNLADQPNGIYFLKAHNMTIKLLKTATEKH